ncbi:hypothetical protein BH10ACT6_BH10ACT6_01220 [soil metagenome]
MSDPIDERIREFTVGALAALTDEQRAECELLANLEPGMRLRPAADDTVELLWGGAVIAITTMPWLNGEDA